MSEHFEDGFNLMCGREIGRGMTRHVFECRLDRKMVVKVEQGHRFHFQNLVEWLAWRSVAGTAYERWFAPVKMISPEGRVLIMHRTEPLRESDLPTKMPAFFTDFKISNYGMFEGRVVCHDYGTHLLHEEGLSKKLKAVPLNHWRTGSES